MRRIGSVLHDATGFREEGVCLALTGDAGGGCGLLVGGEDAAITQLRVNVVGVIIGAIGIGWMIIRSLLWLLEMGGILAPSL